MANSDKYPNADTSAERLAEIEYMFMADETMEFVANDIEKRRKRMLARGFSDQAVVLYDLLAMLHEQRWRRLREEIPPAGNHHIEYAVRSSIGGMILFHDPRSHPGTDLYWRLIPPLPKE